MGDYQMPNSHEWISKTHKLDILREKSRAYDIAHKASDDGSAFDFLKYAGVVPMNMAWTRKNAIPRTNLNPDALPSGYLAEVAFEWDSDGTTSAGEFLDMLEFEVRGTPSNKRLSEVMEELMSED